MSNTFITPKRIARWFLLNLFVAAALCAMTGRYDDPWLWAYVATVAAVGLYPAFWLDDELAKERFSPPESGADRLSLRAVRIIALSHFVVASLDQRWQFSQVPDGVRLLGLVGMAVSVGLVFRAMMTNRFFSAVVRIQKDRGHHVVDQGLYGVIRHPGYAGMIPSMAFSGLALGSWLGVLIGLAYSLLMLRRVLFEDAYLRSHLQGYQEYAARVRYRLIPGVW
jgi:protein-S-isoprenylcysteine O-methyltransferase Ste14